MIVEIIEPCWFIYIHWSLNFYANHFLFLISYPTLPADLSSSGGNNEDTGKEGIRSDDFRWCWSVRVQLCLLPFPPPSRRERHQITICSCSSLLNYRWRDPDAIYCFLVRSTCIFKLLGYQCIGGCIGVMLVCQDAWIKEIIICFRGQCMYSKTCIQMFFILIFRWFHLLVDINNIWSLPCLIYEWKVKFASEERVSESGVFLSFFIVVLLIYHISFYHDDLNKFRAP